jgi:glutathione S-transferase
MKIIETRSAPNPRRVRMFVAEKGLNVAYQELDLMKGDLRTENFTKKNFFQRVPVLELDDGTVISETVAICRYFEETNPTPALFGTGALGRATVEMWNRRMELELLFRIASVFRHTHPSMAHLEVPQVAEWGESNRPKVLDILHFLDKELAGREFIAGNAFSIADITAVCAIDFMRPIRLKRPEGLTHLERWHAAVSGRPSAKA